MRTQIKKSWIVYPPNYNPGDGYQRVRFLNKAWLKACAMGQGSQVWSVVDKTRADGSSSHLTGDIIYEVLP